MTAFSENAKKVLESRYLRRDHESRLIETPDELFQRVAKAVAGSELYYANARAASAWEEAFYRIMHTKEFLPNSPTLMNAGTPKGQLSACFVLPVEDSMISIFDTLKLAALIQQSGGGTGYNFSQLRPRGDVIHSTGGFSSGPVSFMKIYSSAAAYIKQGGKRRGANMGILNVEHPDIEEFIKVKSRENTLSNFNISVGISDHFYKALQKDKKFALIHPVSGKTLTRTDAKRIWELIIHYAWKTGDPGLVFPDAINRGNPTPQIGRIMATNPCGEVPLLPYEPCNLGSLNLSLMTKKVSAEQYEIDWEKLKNTVYTAIRFLDNVIDINHYVTTPIAEMSQGNRKIGLGVMGWAEMLIKLNIPYDSKQAVNLGSELMQFINEEAFKASQQLAQERGPFPFWHKSIHYPDTPVRNATRTSIAPTGTIAIIAGTSPSIEPIYALSFKRMHVLNDQTLYEANPLLIEQLQNKGAFTETIKHKIEQGENPEAFIPDAIKKMLPTAMKIDYKTHIDHQIAFQQYTDNAVSKTINMPGDATEDDIDSAYRYAWENNAKGITIYRDKSKQKQVMNT